MKYITSVLKYYRGERGNSTCQVTYRLVLIAKVSEASWWLEQAYTLRVRSRLRRFFLLLYLFYEITTDEFR